ncbi:MAG: DNA repair protein RecN [Nitrospirae bacterium]|jgi:DNA repair protein RecN (Recombination protein N)|nr:DNA repair protein RecN [Nitrospirota bacterium]
MLKELRIKNLAIIDDIKVSFEHGLNVLTGETGAGKSILIDSLNLILGSRAQPDLIRSGEKEAFVEACFDYPDMKNLPDIGIDFSEGIIIRRNISSSGKNRAYINDSNVSLQTLSEIGKMLVDIHGQHEHQSLMNIEKHCFFLDSFGRLTEDVGEVERLYYEVKDLKEKLNNIKERAMDRAQRIDFLKYQIQEIESAKLLSGEKEALLNEKQILSNIGKLKELSETAYYELYGSEGSCAERLSSVLNKIKEVSSIDNEAIDILSLLESAIPLIDDAVISLRSFKEKYDINPERLNEVEERLETIKKLEKKYGEGIDAVISFKDNAIRELRELESISEQMDFYEEEVSKKEEILLEKARILSEKRRKFADEMSRLIMEEMRELAFNNAVFKIDIKKDSISSYGTDRVEFLFSANLGELPKPLTKIASGGELSRVMLALKAMLADFDSIPVLIFDEVDAGIGGKTAEMVGRKLKRLSQKHQVLCATHLAQIAAKGDLHIKVEKKEKNNRIFVETKTLDDNERLREIARMLSGKITETSLKHAREIIGDKGKKFVTGMNNTKLFG